MATTMSPIGIVIPFRRGDNSGYFEQSFDTFTQKKMSIINLLRTKVGERRMQPTFGSRLWNLAFEQNIDTLPKIANTIVKEDISRWIPGVSVTDVTTDILKSDQTNADKDIYRLHIFIVFTIVPTGQSGNVEVIVDNGKI